MDPDKFTATAAPTAAPREGDDQGVGNGVPVILENAIALSRLGAARIARVRAAAEAAEENAAAVDPDLDPDSDVEYEYPPTAAPTDTAAPTIAPTAEELNVEITVPTLGDISESLSIYLL